MCIVKVVVFLIIHQQAQIIIILFGVANKNKLVVKRNFTKYLSLVPSVLAEANQTIINKDQNMQRTKIQLLTQFCYYHLVIITNLTRANQTYINI